MRILVVDDEEHVRKMMRLTLEAAGYEVTEAADGERGLEQFGDGFQFDATLLDQRMPGIDGLETLRRMKQQRPDSCIIMVTAYSTVDLAVDAMKLGAADFVRKPMTPETLRQAVAAALSKYDKPPALSPPRDASTDSKVREPQQEVPVPPLEIWTTNGYFVRRAGEPTAVDDGTEHHFRVRRGAQREGTGVAVIVEAKVAARLAKQARRNLPADGEFWREQAQRALVNHLWSEAALPDEQRLVITRVTGPMIDAAISWSKD
jgi:DNA-binding response OmpR family regulator